jgi:hypothetical protein
MSDWNPYADPGRQAIDYVGARVKEAVAFDVGDVDFDLVDWCLGTDGGFPARMLLWYKALTSEGVEQSGVIECRWVSEAPRLPSWQLWIAP